MQSYAGSIPPCGIYCGGCPVYQRVKSPCPGAEVRCKQRKCKGIYVCCVEQRGYRFCHECSIFPCSRFRAFAQRWRKYGQDLIENQRRLAELGEEAWLADWNEITEGDLA